MGAHLRNCVSECSECHFMVKTNIRREKTEVRLKVNWETATKMRESWQL